jgi:hypothetical protein
MIEEVGYQQFFKKFNKMIKSRQNKTANLEEINEYFIHSN